MIPFSRLRTTALLLSLAVASTGSAQNLLIENVTLLDGAGGPAESGVWVVVEDGRITAVDNAVLDGPQGATALSTLR